MHGSDLLYRKKYYQLILRHLLQNAETVFANSFYTKKLLTLVPIENTQVHVVYPGVRCEEFTNHFPVKISDEYNGRKILLTVGRLVERKGVPEFIEQVMPKLVKSFPDILYLVVGDDAALSLVHESGMREIIQSRVDSLNLKEHVRMLGNLTEEKLIELYLISDLFIFPCKELPNDAEGFGIVLLEAAISGTPGVATRTGGIPEALIDGSTGFLTEPCDYEGLFQSISKLLTDENLRKSLAEKGKKRVLEEFCWEDILSQYQDFLEKIRDKNRH
jgi:phosphatidyl-myo-inositol dimannoside synthase